MLSSAVPGSAPAVSRVLPIDRLRAFITALVVTHHAVLAYHPYAPVPPASLDAGSMAWGAFPIVDVARAPGIDLLVGFDDAFFMALMFLLAGLFVPGGLARRGAAGYLRERAVRLGLPFLIGAAILAPLAYAATYAQITRAPSAGGFLAQWLALGTWPAGPAWFLWVLLAFGAIAAGLDRLAPRWTSTLGRALFGDGTRPARGFLALVAAGALAYVPTAALVDPMHWSAFGPFFVQTARVPLYLLYFLAGAALGAQGLDRGLLDPEGRLARRWWLWSQAAPAAFFLLVAIFLVLITVMQKGGDTTLLAALCNFAFVLSGATTSFALLAFFVRKMRGAHPLWDRLAANAFGIYVLHYPIVAWLQYALLDVALPGWAKAGLVTALALAASATATAALRRVPAIERVIGAGSRRVVASENGPAAAEGLRVRSA